MEAPDFFVEDLLDLSNGGDDVMTDAFFDTVTGNSTDSSSLTPASDSCNSSVSCAPSFPDAYFNGGDLCVPYDDMAELEWLSNFVEESFSTDDLHKLQFIPTGGAPLGQPGPARPGHNPPTTVPGKARSKRSRVAPCDWSTRLLMVSAPSPATSSSDTSSKKQPSLKRRDNGGPESGPGEVRRCMHCASEKTPQWRTGPMGPKTLCNACGVRYKSGRLVPEYRPAASPTFVSAKHSNSHRKVMELRRQKDVQRHPQPHHHHHQPPQQQQFIGGGGHHMIMATGGGGGNGGEDFFNYHHHHLGGADYRQMI